MIWLKNFLEAFAVILYALRGIGDAFGNLLGDLADGFPNPFKMADAITRFFTSLAGIAFSKIGSSYFYLAADQVEKRVPPDEDIGRPWQHAMTPAQSLRWVGNCLDETIMLISNTGETGIVAFMLQKFGIWAWTTFKRFKKILAILKIRSEADMIQFFAQNLTKKLGFLIIRASLVIFFGILSLCIATTGMILFFGVTVAGPDIWKKFVLFPSHPRARVTEKISRRVGGVRP